MKHLKKAAQKQRPYIKIVFITRNIKESKILADISQRNIGFFFAVLIFLKKGNIPKEKFLGRKIL